MVGPEIRKPPSEVRLVFSGLPSDAEVAGPPSPQAAPLRGSLIQDEGVSALPATVLMTPSTPTRRTRKPPSGEVSLSKKPPPGSAVTPQGLSFAAVAGPPSPQGLPSRFCRHAFPLPATVEMVP